MVQLELLTVAHLATKSVLINQKDKSCTLLTYSCSSTLQVVSSRKSDQYCACVN